MRDGQQIGMMTEWRHTSSDVAIIGMAAQLPGALSVDAFWRNLVEGIESIRPVDAATLIARGESRARIARPNYVPVAAELEQFDGFDPEFFGLGPKDAAIMDPQHRKLLETCWHALEDAGIVPDRFRGPIGVYAGCGQGTYYWKNIQSNRALVEDVGDFLLRHTGNDKDFLATRVSHVLDLKGPSVNVQTACSTSLVAVHQACNALLGGECDLALAGGVTIEMPHGLGYLFRENEILSPDGHCHAFDHRAAGTIFGSGAAVVVLRRLDDALAAGDAIWAVIRGSALNNDGAGKAGYLAPSVNGQANAVAEALAVSGCAPASIGYVECHGTGTALGDPIEVMALTQAFAMAPGAEEPRSGDCLLGSVKTNIGHLDTAAGSAGLIKAALAVHHGLIPPSLSFERPNPAIPFADTPFSVCDRLTEWPSGPTPRRAGVNSLGVGGTNAHVVIEEPPPPPAAEPAAWPFHVIALSARSRGALDANATALADWLQANPGADLADVSWTLVNHRRQFDRRRVLVAADPAEAARMLREPDPRQVFDHAPVGEPPRVVFMLPGGGSQYPGMARDLYQTEPVFRDWMDRGLDHLLAAHGLDLRAVWLPGDGPDALAEAERALRQPSRQLPLLMIVEHALAQLWMSWGVRPDALIGHSMGENTAACLAGVMRFTDCIDLVHLRGTLFDEVPPGGMVSVPAAPAEFADLLGEDLDIAAINGPALTVVSGPRQALDDFAARMAGREIEVQDIPISIAAHSRMLAPILGRFRDFLASIPLSAPQIPVISNRTGQPLTDAEATDPDYWVGHLRGTVRFGDGLGHLAADPERVFLEVGPGRAMSAMAQAHPAISADRVVSSLRHPQQALADDRYFLMALARLWATGVEIDWDQIWAGARRQRLRLPGYQFQRQRYFIEPAATGEATAQETGPLERIEEMEGWGWRRGWRMSATGVEIGPDGQPLLQGSANWLIFSDGSGKSAGTGQALAEALRARGQRVSVSTAGDRFADLGEGRFTLPPESGREGYGLLLAALDAAGLRPDHIVHLWTLDARAEARAGSTAFDSEMQRGFYGLMHLGQAIGAELGDHPVTLTLVTDGAQKVGAEPMDSPELATVAGPLQVMPREMPNVAVRWIDLRLPQSGRRGGRTAATAAPLVEELCAPPRPGTAEIVAWREGRRFSRDLLPVALPAPPETPIRAGDVCLITGGFGGVAQALARGLAGRGARLVLLGRTPPDARGHRGRRQREAVAALERRGAEVLALRAELTDPESVAAAVTRAIERFGRIDVVLHAAGVIDDGLMADKEDAAAADVLAPKLYGALNLIRALDGRPPRLTVLFSSSSTVLGAAGQADYVAANAWLDALAAAQPPALGRTVAVNWGVWADSGMAARATGNHAVDAVDAGAAPLLSGVGPDGFVAELRPDHWLIDGHRTETGQALLPGTGVIELMAEALAASDRALPFALRDLNFLRPVLVSDREPARVVIRIDDENRITLDDRAGEGPNATARVEPAALPDATARLAIAAGGWQREDAAGLRSAQEGRMRFGPEWRVLRALRLDGSSGVALLGLDPAFAPQAERMWLHPALLDIATGWAMDLIPGYDRANLWVPLSYDRITVLERLPHRILSRVRLLDATGGTARFAVTLTDTDGRPVAEIDGFALRRLEDGLPAAATRARPSPAEERLRHNTRLGIRAEEGMQVLDRAVAAALDGDLPQVYVSTLDLPALVAQTGQQDREAGPGQAFERPEMEGAFVAPAPGTQAELAEVWSRLLGIREVGAEDSFFDLGGHSLIAVRLFSQIRKQFGVDFPISTLFEAPTVAALAARIDARTGRTDSGQPAAAAGSASPPATSFRFVVDMGGRVDGGLPFFIVAGMFGNVMNLRAMAQRLGRDRHVYGLQAKGLFGSDAPHDDFEDAARDYLDEIRQVQPQGPYLLGGFSGGGLIALEMARQLVAAGETVAQLVMLDTPLPMRGSLTRGDKLAIRMGEMREQGLAFPGNWVRGKLAYRRKIREKAALQVSETQFHNLAIEAGFRAALPKVQLRQWDGPATLMRPPLDRRWRVWGGRWVSEGRTYVIPDNGWSEWMPQLQVIEVPGDHDSMVLEPSVRVLVARLSEILKAADAQAQADAEAATRDPDTMQVAEAAE